MSCAQVQAELVAFHFGLAEGEPRAALEAHLASCPECLGAFLAVKRDVETAEAAPLPSPARRARVREAVARELGLAAAPRRWSWWERPLAFAWAGLTVLLAVLAVQAIAASPGVPPLGLSAPAERSP